MHIYGGKRILDESKEQCKFHEMETCLGSSRNREVIVADLQWPVERTVN